MRISFTMPQPQPVTHPRRFHWLMGVLLVVVAACGLQRAIAAEGSATEFAIADPDEDRKPTPAQPKSARKYDTFAHHVLDIDSQEAPVSQAKYALLDAIIDDAKQRNTYDPSIQEPGERIKQAERILQQIDDVLTDHNFLYPPGDYDVTSLRASLAPQRYDRDALERILRVQVNQRRRDHARAHAEEPFYITDCDISSFIFLGVGDALGIDLHLVDLPDHMFVRWQFADGTHVNWDTNDAKAPSDKDYAADYAMGKRLRKRRIYLATMTPREAEGYAYFLRGQRFEDREQPIEAIADMEKSRELYPQSTQARSDLAWLYATAACVDERHRKESLSLAQSALDLEPQCAMFWDSIAAAHAANGDFKRAAKEAGKAEGIAESPEDRAEFKAHRRSFEAGKMPTTPHPH